MVLYILNDGSRSMEGSSWTVNAATTFNDLVTVNDNINMGTAHRIRTSSNSTTLTLDSASTADTGGGFIVLHGGTSSGHIQLIHQSSGDVTIIKRGSGDTFVFNNDGKLDFVTAPTTTAAPGAGFGDALPATPEGYLTIKVNGTDRQIAFY